jgi:hypothetical protein
LGSWKESPNLESRDVKHGIGVWIWRVLAVVEVVVLLLGAGSSRVTAIDVSLVFRLFDEILRAGAPDDVGGEGGRSNPAPSIASYLPSITLLKHHALYTMHP